MNRLLTASALAAAVVLGQPSEPRFRLGDDPAWASPQFDDSGWQPLPDGALPLRLTDLNQNVTWTRWRVFVPSSEPMLFIARCFTDCGLWLDGERVGDHTGHRVAEVAAVAPPGKWVTVAVRSWLPPGAIIFGTNFGRIQLLPAAQAIAKPGALVLYPDMLPNIFTALALAVILIHLLLQTFTGRASREVRIRAAWMAVFLICNGGSFATAKDYRISAVFSIAVTPAILAMVGLSGGLQWRGILAFIGCFLAIRLPYLIGSFFETPQPWTSLAAQLHVASMPVAMAFAMFLLDRARRRGASTWFMASVVVAYPLYLLNLVRPDWAPQGIPVAGLLFRWNIIATLLFGLAAAIDVVLQNRREQASAARLQGELDSGRQAQLELVSSSASQTPGYEIQVEYQPAAEVGGDFYLILPRSDGATLVVVGDVSGKGLQAAMRTSFVIALIRTHREQPPDTLLTLVNQAMDGGAKSFVTACAVLLREDGIVEYANAGHLAPISNGSEWPVPDELPLGVVNGVDYTGMRRQIGPGERIILLTDGVVEAANSKGELFGFDRTREISTNSANEIAEAARAWGQNDDITVVTVRRAVA